MTQNLCINSSSSSQQGDSTLDEVEASDPEVDVRQELYQLTVFLPPLLHSLVQDCLTRMTGKPYPGEFPLFKQTRFSQLMTALASLFCSVAVSVTLWNSFPLLWFLLPISWLFTVGAARKLHTTICHQCIHYNFLGDWRDRILAEIISTLLLIQDFNGYRQDHVKEHHHIEKFTTVNDPDLKFLLLLGFRPGLPKPFYWQLLRQTVLSPRFHWLFLCARLIANFKTAPVYRRLMATVWTAAVLSMVTLTHLLPAFIVAWLFPLTVLYHISALLQFSSEHRWLLVEGGSNEN